MIRRAARRFAVLVGATEVIAQLDVRFTSVSGVIAAPTDGDLSAEGLS
jgi:hypothetical protein